MAALMRPGDVLLVEGDQRISQVVSYLTTSPWTHAALYLGDLATEACHESAARHHGLDTRELLLEALPDKGVLCVPLAKYERSLVRVCRPRGLDAEGVRGVVAYAVAQLGKTYDLDNVTDLGRYFLPAGLVPARFRLDALHFGAGKATEVICSSLLAAAFESVGFPVNPVRRPRETLGRRFLRVLMGPRLPPPRKAPVPLVVPRDFDLSPYFDIVKPEPPEERRKPPPRSLQED